MHNWTGAVAANGLPITTALSVAAGSTLDLGGGNQQAASLSNVSGAGGSVINSASGTITVLTLTPTSGATTFSGVIAGGGTLGTIGLTMNGPGGAMVLAGQDNSRSPNQSAAADP